MSNELSPRGESRRDFLKQGVTFLAQAATMSEVPVAALGVQAYDFFDPLVTLYNEREILHNYAATNNKKPYGQELSSHRYAVFGDSNAYGNIVDDQSIAYPAPLYITRGMQRSGYDWDVKNLQNREQMSGHTREKASKP